MGTVKLRDDKIYYMCHPYTGTDMYDVEKHLEQEKEIYAQLINEYPEAHIIRPFKIVPSSFTWNKAMQICLALLDVCDGLILCPGYTRSIGCMKELNRFGGKIIKLEDIQV